MKKLCSFIILGIISSSVILNISIMYGQQQKDVNSTSTVESVKVLAILHANSGSITDINTTGYLLQLNDLSDKTILFSDRSDRIVITESTTNFIGNWSTCIDSFAIDAPNTVLVVDEIEGQQDTAIVELFNPTYDSNKKTLKYDVIPDNTTSISLPKEFGQSTLIHDAINDVSRVHFERNTD